MVRRLIRHLGILGIVAGSMMIAVPVLAYTDTTPGSGGSTSTSSVAAGGSVQFNVTMNGANVGDTVTFSGATAAVPQIEAFVVNAEAATCTVSFNPTSATLNASHQASTTATFSSGCAGQNVTLVATGPAGQQVTATVAVAGGFPNTSTSPVPFGWIVMAIGAVLILAGIAGVAWRRNPEAAAAA